MGASRKTATDSSISSPAQVRGSIVSIRLAQNQSCSAGSMRRKSSQDSQIPRKRDMNSRQHALGARAQWRIHCPPQFIAVRELDTSALMSHHAHIHKHVVQHPITRPYVSVSNSFFGTGANIAHFVALAAHAGPGYTLASLPPSRYWLQNRLGQEFCRGSSFPPLPPSPTGWGAE